MSNPKFNVYLTAFQERLSRFSEVIDNETDGREGIDELQHSDIKKLNAKTGVHKQKERLAKRDELIEKLIILDKASLLKHFTSSIVVEEDDHVTGVLLNKANGEAEIIRVPLGDVKAKDDFLNRVRSQYNFDSI